jgi:hypothetical protein
MSRFYLGAVVLVATPSKMGKDWQGDKEDYATVVVSKRDSNFANLIVMRRNN